MSFSAYLFETFTLAFMNNYTKDAIYVYLIGEN